MRADSGFCRRRLMRWCERHGVGCIVGLARNPRLAALAAPAMALAEAGFAESGLKQRHFAELTCGARSRDRMRRVIARIEHGPRGANPRFVVTDLAGDGRALYEGLCCARGEMENRVREQQLQLFADRTSCHRWWPDQFRLLLASLAHTLLDAIRRLGLQGTRMVRAQCATIRLRLLKIGAVIVRNTRRVRFHLSSACPEQDFFRLVAARLKPGWRPAHRPVGSSPCRSRNRQPRRTSGPREIQPNPTKTTIPADRQPSQHPSVRQPRRKNTAVDETASLHEISGLRA